MNVQHEVDRFLTLLRNKIHERGFTQLEVQAALGWGRSYISQLLTRQKALRIEQVLLILGVIDIPAAEFFAELYATAPYRSFGSHGAAAHPKADTAESVAKLRAELNGMVDLLLEKKLITAEELSAAVHADDQEGDQASDLPTG